ncbi:Uma2 family endonuclease [Streptomyces ficellus]|uniref:Uma2 family endonuclease n=1 Tax=Streptomyces ficellus TaxID=1977088 RepID=A0A6I6FA20_9ACTN|nr:Uma2 family endonuclease [Streptomyces ficellus]QGV79931.1 Uma2 family endonuclease [Streptomyces ficellus]
MTPGSDEPAQMPVEDFEELARAAPETVTLEFIGGRLKVKPVPDGDHAEITMWLIRQCMQQRPELDLHPKQGLLVESYRKGRARPDGALAPVGYFAGHGDWADAAGVLMTVEVTSFDSDTDSRDRREKGIGYAQTGIPVFLLVDRSSDTVTVHSEPSHGTYQKHVSYKYGDTVTLPDPVGITLDTEKLKDFAH